LLREALKRMGRADLIGKGKRHLVPAWQPKGTGDARGGKRTVAANSKPFRTQHTGLPDAAGQKSRQHNIGSARRR